jgi:hypothetical protein
MTDPQIEWEVPPPASPEEAEFEIAENDGLPPGFDADGPEDD